MTILTTRLQGAVLGAAVALALSGCSSTPDHDQRFSQRVRGLMSSQVIDPTAAERVSGQPAGLDGRAVRASMDGYAASYKAPPASDVTGGGSR